MEPVAKKKVVLVDDHKLFRKGVAELINDFEGFEVAWEAENGRDFTSRLVPGNLPDIVILDISMPVMDGLETACWMEQRYPEVKILILTMHNDNKTILQMLNCGVNGYVLKNAEPSELQLALHALESSGCYFPGTLSRLFSSRSKSTEAELSEREKEFLKLTCTELPYKSFAPFLKVHPRAVEALRDSLFRKLEVESRVGLVIYAIKNGIFKIE